MQISVRPAKKSERDNIDILLQYYLHDFSEFEAVEIDPNGRYTYPYLDMYWQDPRRSPFLIYIQDNIAGFALVQQEVDPANGSTSMDLSEFFVLRVFRNQGIGNKAATILWEKFPGAWQVRVLKSNKPGYPFWQHAISRHTIGQYKEQVTKEGFTFIFDSTS
jgi:predicted acetyltransferase